MTRNTQTSTQVNTQASRSDYNPSRLLDILREHLQLPSDDALAQKLRVTAAVIDDIRHGHIPIAGSMLIWMSDVTGMSIMELRALLGDRRTKSRLRTTILSASRSDQKLHELPAQMTD